MLNFACNLKLRNIDEQHGEWMDEVLPKNNEVLQWTCCIF